MRAKVLVHVRYRPESWIGGMIAKRQDSVVIPPSRVAFLFFFFKGDYTYILSMAVSFAMISLFKKTLGVALENYEVYNRAKLSRNINCCTNCRPN